MLRLRIGRFCLNGNVLSHSFKIQCICVIIYYYIRMNFSCAQFNNEFQIYKLRFEFFLFIFTSLSVKWIQRDVDLQMTSISSTTSVHWYQTTKIYRHRLVYINFLRLIQWIAYTQHVYTHPCTKRTIYIYVL